MLENFSQERSFSLKSDSSLEGVDEPKKEPDQRWRNTLIGRVLQHKYVRTLMLCVALLAIITSFVLLLSTRSILPLFGNIVLVCLLDRCLDAYLRKTDPHINDTRGKSIL